MDAPLEDKVVRQGARHRAVPVDRMEIDLGNGSTHTCWTEDADITTAEASLDRGWVGNKGVSAPGIRFVDSRPVVHAKEDAVYPQDDDCAVIYKEPGTYTMTLH